MWDDNQRPEIVEQLHKYTAILLSSTAGTYSAIPLTPLPSSNALSLSISVFMVLFKYSWHRCQ